MEKFTNNGGNIIIYHTDDDDYRLELWGASTKHPDSIFYFHDFLKAEYIENKYQIFQWLLECASKLTFPFHAKELADYAIAQWYNW